VNLDLIDSLTAGRLGVLDVPCPICGPEKRSQANRRRKVLRVWRLGEGFATYCCARCGASGHTREPAAPPPDPARIEEIRRESEARERIAVRNRLEKARWLWGQRRSIAGTPAETYLRTARGYAGRIPETLGFLPDRGFYPPAMVAAFGIPTEPEPGRITIDDDALTGVHITRIAPDGRGKAGSDYDKVMIGRSLGCPIALAPVNDLGGLFIAEGIEDALSAHEATGLGAWAAGAASRLPALAAVVRSYVDVVSIAVDPDPDGIRYAAALAAALVMRGVATRKVPFAPERAPAP
jgi:hypothetical protein